MLAKVGLITDAERDAIIEGLKAIERDIESEQFRIRRVRMEDIHMVIEAALIKRIGEPGKKLHTGRSRNDQVGLDFAMWIYETVDADPSRTAHRSSAGEARRTSTYPDQGRTGENAALPSQEAENAG